MYSSLHFNLHHDVTTVNGVKVRSGVRLSCLQIQAMQVRTGRALLRDNLGQRPVLTRPANVSDTMF